MNEKSMLSKNPNVRFRSEGSCSLSAVLLSFWDVTGVNLLHNLSACFESLSGTRCLNACLTLSCQYYVRLTRFDLTTKLHMIPR